MDKREIVAKLTEIFRDVFDDDSINITPQMSADDLEEWDSISHISLISSVEGEFGIKFSMPEVVGMKNVGEMVNIIFERVN